MKYTIYKVRFPIPDVGPKRAILKRRIIPFFVETFCDEDFRVVLWELMIKCLHLFGFGNVPDQTYD